MKTFWDKKVLLRERKRHTARPCSEYSFCCPTRVPPGGGGGTRTSVPPPPPPGGYPDLGTPPGGGYPDLGTPPGGVPGPWYPPRGGTQTSVPPLPHGILGNVAKALWDMGTPPPLWTDRRMDGRTDACQNITFPRTTYAGGKNSNQKFYNAPFFRLVTK